MNKRRIRESAQVQDKNNIVVIQCLFRNMLTDKQLNMKTGIVSAANRRGLDFELFYQVDGDTMRKLLGTTLLVTNCVNWREAYDKPQVVDILSKFQPFDCILTDFKGERITGDEMSSTSQVILRRRNAQLSNFSVFRFSFYYAGYSAIVANIPFYADTSERVTGDVVQIWSNGKPIGLKVGSGEYETELGLDQVRFRPAYMTSGYWDQFAWDNAEGAFVKTQNVASPFIPTLTAGGHKSGNSALYRCVNSEQDLDDSKLGDFLNLAISSGVTGGADLRTVRTASPKRRSRNVMRKHWVREGDAEINELAHMLDMAMSDKSLDEVDLSRFGGSMTAVIQGDVLEKLNDCHTKYDVFDLVKAAFAAADIDTQASRRLLANIQRAPNLFQAMSAVTNSMLYGQDLGVGGRRRTLREAQPLDERRMAGPAAARSGGVDEIADMRQKLESGVVEFRFMKHSDSGDVMRHAVGTTSEQVIPTSMRRALDPNYDENVASYERRSNFIIWFWDLEKNAVRCFNTNRFEGIDSYVQTAERVDSNEVQRFGDIYVHRDVDAGAAQPGPQFTQETAAEITSELGRLARQGGVRLGIDSADLDASVQFGDNDEPVLRIEISKRGSDADQPYQLRINQLRQEIRRRWNVDIKRVEVTGLFTY